VLINDGALPPTHVNNITSRINKLKKKSQRPRVSTKLFFEKSRYGIAYKLTIEPNIAIAPPNFDGIAFRIL